MLRVPRTLDYKVVLQDNANSRHYEIFLVDMQWHVTGLTSFWETDKMPLIRRETCTFPLF